MRKFTAFGFAVCGTLLLLLLFVAGRMLFIKFHTQTYEDIAGRGMHTEMTVSENDTVLQTVTDEEQITGFAGLLSSYIYTEYPHFFRPASDSLTASCLTVTFENGASIGVNADGYVFVSGKLRDVEGSRGKELYHQLYQLAYPSAV